MHYIEQILICCSASAILSISLGGIAGAAVPMGPLRVSQTNSRYFTDDRGQAIYLTGSHTWLNLQDSRSTEFNYDQFLDFLEQHNHNFFRLWVKEYLVYQPKPGQPFQVTLQSSRYRYEWFDTQTGRTGDSGIVIVDNADQTFAPTFKNGAVIYLMETNNEN